MNAMPVPAITQEPSPAPLSQGSRIVNTFIAPSKTFTDFRRSASWWAPWLLITLVSLIFIYSMDRNVGFDQISKTELTKNARQMEQFDKLSPKDQANNMRFRTILTRVLAYGFPAFALIAWVVITAVLMGAFNFGAGASVSFKVAFAIVVYSSLPGILHALLGTISLFAGNMSGSLDKEAFNINNPFASNPAYFMDPSANKFLYSMATAVDIFMIWTLVLMGIGFACNSKVKRGTAIGIVAGLYLAYKLAASLLIARFT
jgi:Yip1 domain